MSKEMLSREIKRELDKLNDVIDRKIIGGVSYRKEALRHKELTATLQRMRNEADDTSTSYGRLYRTRRGTSPARRRLERGVFGRLFSLGQFA